MPRRRVLTDAQVESLLALPIDEPLLVRHWTLDEKLTSLPSSAAAESTISSASPCSSCAFRYPGRRAPTGWRHDFPEPALNFVAEQLQVSSDALVSYAARPPDPA